MEMQEQVLALIEAIERTIMLVVRIVILSVFNSLGVHPPDRRYVPGPRTALPTGSQAAMRRLFQSCFDEAELRCFFGSIPGSPDRAARLPGIGASLAQIAHQAVLQLEREGLLTVALARLRRERPHRAREIDAVHALMTGSRGRRPSRSMASTRRAAERPR